MNLHYTFRPLTSPPPRAPGRRAQAALETPSQASSLRELVPGLQTDLVVAEGPFGRGLFYSTECWRQRILSVPLSSCILITDDPLDGSSIFGESHLAQWEKAHGKLPTALRECVLSSDRWDLRLTAWLLYIKKEVAPVSPLYGSYVSSLPPFHTSLMCFASDQERAALQDRELALEARGQRKWVEEMHAKHLAATSGSPLAGLNLTDSLEETLWAAAAVRSRTFSETINSENTSVMVPYADFCNHSSSEANAQFGAQDDGLTFAFTSFRHSLAGSECLISYGDKSNADLIRDYGFTSEGNHADRALTKEESARYPLNKDIFLDYMGINPNSFRLKGRLNASAWLKDFPEPIERGRIEAACRTLQLDGDGGASTESSQGFRWPWEAAASASPSLPRERKNAEDLVNLARRLAGSFPTTLAEDEAELRALYAAPLAPGSTLQQRERFAAALRLRAERKRVLNTFIEVVRLYVKHLDSGGAI